MTNVPEHSQTELRTADIAPPTYRVMKRKLPTAKNAAASESTAEPETLWLTAGTSLLTTLSLQVPQPVNSCLRKHICNGHCDGHRAYEHRVHFATRDPTSARRSENCCASVMTKPLSGLSAFGDNNIVSIGATLLKAAVFLPRPADKTTCATLQWLVAVRFHEAEAPKSQRPTAGQVTTACPDSIAGLSLYCSTPDLL